MRPVEAVNANPYIELKGDKDVLLQPPPDNRGVPKAAQIFSFDKIFSPESTQAEFFNQTARPLVEKLLHGENGLLFSYGVTNSGKT